MRGKWFVLLATFSALLLGGTAQAGVRVGVRFGFPLYFGPAYYPYRVYAPAPVYVAPAPVYVVPQQPVYVQPAPVYMQPAYYPPPIVQTAPPPLASPPVAR